MRGQFYFAKRTHAQCFAYGIPFDFDWFNRVTRPPSFAVLGSHCTASRCSVATVARSVWFWKTVNVERSGFSWSFGLEIFYSWGSVGTDGTEKRKGIVGKFLFFYGWLAREGNVQSIHRAAAAGLCLSG